MPTRGAAYPRRNRRIGYKRNRYAAEAMPRLRLSKSMSERSLGKPYRFIRTQQDGLTIVNSCGAGPTPAPTLGAMIFTLDSVPAYTEFTALFDQYRIMWVRVDFFPSSQMREVVVNNNYDTPPFFTAIDYDDGIAPASLDALMQYANCRRHQQLDKKFSVFIRPRCLGMVYLTAIATAYQLAPYGSWLDCATANVPHYGLHYGCGPVALVQGDVTLYNFTVTYCLEFKNTR